MKSIILIGDSIRIGYAPFVRNELRDVAQVWEPEKNGFTSTNVLLHLEPWVLARRADVVHLNCGLHDLARDPIGEGKVRDVRVQVEEYEKNVREILSRVQQSGAAIIWATITPVHEENHRTFKGMQRWESDIEKYNEAASRVAHQLNVPINDLNLVVAKAGRDKVLLPDGVHYTEAGYELLGQAVADFLREYL
jgi:lysophospholipase L1-like esterase